MVGARVFALPPLAFARPISSVRRVRLILAGYNMVIYLGMSDYRRKQVEKLITRSRVLPFGLSLRRSRLPHNVASWRQCLMVQFSFFILNVPKLFTRNDVAKVFAKLGFKKVILTTARPNLAE
jgi:hypothetical protein